MQQAFGPNGIEIVGSKEVIPGTAGILGWENGEPNYDGETEVDWDNQQTVRRDDELVYIDDHGNEWLRGQLTFKDV